MKEDYVEGVKEKLIQSLQGDYFLLCKEEVDLLIKLIDENKTDFYELKRKLEK